MTNARIHWAHLARSLACMLVLVVLVAFANSVVRAGRIAFAAEREASPSVLIVDSNLGDYDRLMLTWLGERHDVVDANDGITLATATEPTWWATGGGEGEAPSTFVLSAAPGNSIDANDVAWALDAIADFGAEGRTFVIGAGTCGLRVREYAENLAATKQSDRANIAGLAFLGTPHNGYEAQATYPLLNHWKSLANASGFAGEDLLPESSFLNALNAKTFPAVSKSLVVLGNVGDLGFGVCDGAGTMEDLTLGASVTDQIVVTQATATVSCEVNLSGSWLPATSAIDYPGKSVDTNLASRLSAMQCYENSPEVLAQVVEFYQSWFSQGAPVTHNASVLALDLSGSMLEDDNDGMPKIDGAREATEQYLRVVKACSRLPHAAPTDVTVLGFEESVRKVCAGYDDDALAAVARTDARRLAETNIGQVLEEAVSNLAASPRCAKRHITLLSDGASTMGPSNEAMLNGVVSEARRNHIVIDTVGFGNAGESNASFLKEVSKATGGTYYQASNAYELKVDFLKSYYGSLGMELKDEEVRLDKEQVIALGKADERTSALQVGVVTDGSKVQVMLEHEGKPLDGSTLEVVEAAGLTSILCEAPEAGEYSIRLSGGSGQAHVFAVKELGIASRREVNGEQADFSFVMLAAVAVGLVACIVALVIITRRRS
ncbi:MAG: vWA domain-containing protein [Coriobacteriales bacterium]|nr:vWA domain-containing protein [Coriobacteriales bacterium]